MVANFLVYIQRRWKIMIYAIIALLIYFCIHMWNFVNISEPFFIPRSDLQSQEIFLAAERYLNAGEIDKAINRYKRVTKLRPSSGLAVESLEKLGFIYFYLGRYEVARDYWGQGLQIDPYYQRIHQHLRFSEMAYADNELRVYFKFGSIDEPTVIYRQDFNPRFEMWFEAFRTPGIGYAFSDNGINWIRATNEDQVVIWGTGKKGDWNQLIETPEVAFYDGKYLMNFVGYNYDINKDGNRNIMDESADGIGLTSSFNATQGWSDPVKIISRSSVKKAWDHGYVGDPSSLIFDPIENRFHIWYTGCKIFNGQRKIHEELYYFGHAYTAKKAEVGDPNSWHKTNPNQLDGYVFAPSEDKLAFDSGEIFDPSVLWNDNDTRNTFSDDYFEMWYTAYSKENGNASIGYTTSHTRGEASENNVPFGTVWNNQRYVAYRGDAKSDFDDDDMYEANVIRVGSTLRLYYVGSKSGNNITSVGMALSSPENMPFFFEFEHNPMSMRSNK